MTECPSDVRFIYGICCWVHPHFLLLLVTFVLTEDQSTTVRRVKLVTYVLSFARTECYRFIVVVVEPRLADGVHIQCVLIVFFVRSRNLGCYLHLSLSV